MQIKLFTLILIACVLLVPAASATPIAACSVESYAALQAQGSCTINGLLFDTFTISDTAGGSAGAISPSSITVTPITTAGDEGFAFSFGSSVGSNSGQSSFQDELLGFHISTVNSTPTIDDLTLSFSGAGFTGTGTTSVVETYCAGHVVTGCPTSNSIQVNDPPPSFSDTVNISGTSSLYVTKDINTTSGTAGTAYISSVSNSYSHGTVPEPWSMLLVGSGLVGVGLMRKFRKS